MLVGFTGVQDNVGHVKLIKEVKFTHIGKLSEMCSEFDHSLKPFPEQGLSR